MALAITSCATTLGAFAVLSIGVMPRKSREEKSARHVLLRTFDSSEKKGS